MENNFLVLLDSHTNSEGLYPLTKKRSIGTVPFFGKYRLIDITLTAIKNAGCQNVGIFPNNNVRSLSVHLKNATTWNLSKKKDGITIFQTDRDSLIDEGITYTRLEQNIDYLIRSKQQYVVIAHSHAVHDIDLKEIVEFHINSGEKYTKVVSNEIDTGFYVLEKVVLLSNVLNSTKTFEHNVYDSIENSSSVACFEFGGYFKEINTIRSYLDISFEFLENVKDSKNTFCNIITKDTLQKPTKYMDGSTVSNSVIADSCYIKGQISDSIIFKDNKIGSNSSVDKTIMFDGSNVGENVFILNALIDKDVVIKDGVRVISRAVNPIYIKKGSVISEDCIM